MTVSSETKRAAYTGDGSTVTFTVPFYFLEETDLAVYDDDTLQTITTDYTVSGEGNPAGGSVTFVAAPDNGNSVVILRDAPLTQATDYIENDTFPADSHEEALDKLTMITQQLQEQIDRSVIAAVSSTVTVTLPTPDAGKALLWNSGEDNLENSTDDFNDIVTDAETAQTAAEAAQTAAESAQTASETAQTAAETAQTAAETAETNAETAETNAEAWAEAVPGSNPPGATHGSAKAWAETAEDTEVVSGSYSAMHWALKAAANLALKGLVIRPKFTYNDVDEFVVGPGLYHHDGTTEQYVNWSSDLTIAVSSPSTDTWYYLYIDDSAVVTAGTPVLTASEFLWSTTAPTWSDSKRGWYNGADRCIFAALTDGSGDFYEIDCSGDLVQYCTGIGDRSDADLDTTAETVTLSIPAFATKAQVSFSASSPANEASSLVCRRYGYTGFGHAVCQVNDSSGIALSVCTIITDSSQRIDIRMTASNQNTGSVASWGWYFPEGM